MMRILKYPLPLAGGAVIHTGKLWRCLAVGFQSGSPVLWVEGEVGNTEELRVWVGLTGDEVPDGLAYVGSAQLTAPSGLLPELPYYVVHVYIKPDSPRATVRPSPEPLDTVVQPPPSTPLIAYARIEKLNDGNWYAVCPECAAHIALHDRKDEESFTKREYIEHYASAHAKLMVPIPWIALLAGIIVVLAFLNAYWSWREEPETRERLRKRLGSSTPVHFATDADLVRWMTWMRLQGALYILLGAILVLSFLWYVGVR